MAGVITGVRAVDGSNAGLVEVPVPDRFCNSLQVVLRIMDGEHSRKSDLKLLGVKSSPGTCLVSDTRRAQAKPSVRSLRLTVSKARIYEEPILVGA